MRDQLDQAAQPAVVLRLVGQMRKPARQHPLDQAEELPVELIPIAAWQTANATSSASLINAGRPPRAGTGYSSAKTYACNDKGFQIRHLELQSRGDTGLEALRLQPSGSLRDPPDFHIHPTA